MRLSTRFISLALLGAVLLPQLAQATAGPIRKVRFSATGQNIINSDSVNTPQQSSCMITVSNTSPNSQIIALREVTAYATGTWDGPGTLDFGSAPYNTEITVSANNSVSFIYLYPFMPAETPGTQTLVCQGTLEAREADVTAPGFVIANGILNTYIEQGAATQIVGDGGGEMRGTMAGYQGAIVIGEGRPF
jgi:hypothetical protein